MPVPVTQVQPGWVNKLNLSDSVELDSQGNGQVMLSPANGSTMWQVYEVKVTTNQGAATPVPVAELFDTPVPTAASTYGATQAGNDDVYEAVHPVIIGPTDTLLVTWTGGVPGTLATARVRGLATLRGY